MINADIARFTFSRLTLNAPFRHMLVRWSWPLRRSIFDPVAKSMDLTTETIEIEGCVVYLVMDGSFVVDDYIDRIMEFEW